MSQKKLSALRASNNCYSSGTVDFPFISPPDAVSTSIRSWANWRHRLRPQIQPGKWYESTSLSLQLLFIPQWCTSVLHRTLYGWHFAEDNIFLYGNYHILFKCYWSFFFGSHVTNLTNPTMHMPHVPQYATLEQKCSRLCSNVVWQVYCGLCQISPTIDDKLTFYKLMNRRWASDKPLPESMMTMILGGISKTLISP